MVQFVRGCSSLQEAWPGLQTPRSADLEVSDSRAVNLLQMTKDKMDQWTDVTVDFVMTTTMPDQTQNKQTWQTLSTGVPNTVGTPRPHPGLRWQVHVELPARCQ